MTITVYQKPTCTTCRAVHKALTESGVDFDLVDYYVHPIPTAKLNDLLRKMKMKPRDLLRTTEAIYKTLKLGERSLSDEEIVDFDGPESGSDSTSNCRKRCARDFGEAGGAGQGDSLVGSQ